MCVSHRIFKWYSDQYRNNKHLPILEETATHASSSISLLENTDR